METVAQWIRTSWTKASRGGAAATRRNSTPPGYPLPLAVAPLLHEVTLHERDDFAPVSEHRRPTPTDLAGLWIREKDGLLSIGFGTTQGVPRREWRPGRVLLARGEWLRWRINYRFSHCCGGWSYQADTLNLAHGPVPADTFLGEPTRLVDERAHLR
ncbi:hypothetical protein AB0M43_17055 [Longispora sp. NPDC051575]|uniref:hypothetical protein n=1 Tax=Longispora sp. NPDC051575 TaxID=3154943 RepID=UPI00343CC6BC